VQPEGTEPTEPTARASTEMLTANHNQAKEMFFVFFLKHATAAPAGFAH